MYFRRTFHSVLARAVNALQGKRDHVFTGAEPSVVQVLTKEELMKDLLVRTIAEYPSFHTYGMRIRSTKSVEPLRGRRPRSVSKFKKARQFQYSQRSRFLRP